MGRSKSILTTILLLLVGVYAAALFLPDKKEETVLTPPAKRIPIKGAPVITDIKEPRIAQAKKEITEKEKTETGSEGLTVIIGTYAPGYGIETAKERLKGAGIQYSSREADKKLVMNRVLIGEVKDKAEARQLLSDLAENGYEPFSIHINGVYRVYAASNLNEKISNDNKADLENLDYTPVIEKKAVIVKVRELITKADSKEEAKELSSKLEKMGFNPELVINGEQLSLKISN